MRPIRMLPLLLLIFSHAGARANGWDDYIVKLLFGVQPTNSKDAFIEQLSRVTTLSFASAVRAPETDPYMIAHQTCFYFYTHPLFSFPFKEGIIAASYLDYPDTLGYAIPDSDSYFRLISMGFFFEDKAAMEAAYTALTDDLRKLSEKPAGETDHSQMLIANSEASLYLKNNAGRPIQYLHIVSTRSMAPGDAPGEYAITIWFYGSRPAALAKHDAGR